MPKCKDCKHFKPIDDEMGDCIGYEISGERTHQNALQMHLSQKKKTDDKKEK